MMSAILAAEGVIAEEASDVRGAMERLDRGRFDVVLLDVGLGEHQSGFDVLRAIRGRPELSDVKVVLVSAKGADADTIAEGLVAGADDIVVKPFRPEQLRATVRAATSQPPPRRAARAASMNAARSAPLNPLPFVDDRTLITGAVVSANAVVSEAFDVVLDDENRLTAMLISPERFGTVGALAGGIARGALRTAIVSGMPLGRALRRVEEALAAQRADLGAVGIGLVRFSASGLIGIPETVYDAEEGELEEL